LTTANDDTRYTISGCCRAPLFRPDFRSPRVEASVAERTREGGQGEGSVSQFEFLDALT
jgi:hypothetical protein